MRIPVMLLAVAAGALALAGCGGDTSTTTDRGHDGRDHDDAGDGYRGDDHRHTADDRGPEADDDHDRRRQGGRPQGGIERPTVAKGDEGRARRPDGRR